MLEIALIVFGLIAGVVGTWWRDPPDKVKWAVIGVLLISNGAGIYKSIADDRDKELLQVLAFSGLDLPNGAYDTVFDQVGKVLTKNGYSPEFDCRHDADGVMCDIESTDKSPATFVLSRFEAAKIYAYHLGKKNTKAYIKSLLDQVYDPRRLDEDYKDKVGIVGVMSYYFACSEAPVGYDYDNQHGVRVRYDAAGKLKQIAISVRTLQTAAAGPGSRLFQVFRETFRQEIDAAIPECKAAAEAE